MFVDCYLFQDKFLHKPAATICEPTKCQDLEFPRVSPVDMTAYDNVTWKGIAVTQYEAVDIECKTREQSNCPLWFQERKCRVTASQMSQIVNRRAPATAKFTDSIFKATAFHTATTSYGLANETVAKQKYLAANPFHHLHTIGLVINPQFPFLAATPELECALVVKR